jgi:hypothetical protein
MSEATRSRRSRGEDAIYFATAKNRYVGSVSLGYVIAVFVRNSKPS